MWWLWLACDEDDGPKINEVCADYAGVPDPSVSGDWVELYARVETPLAGWSLSTDDDGAASWPFPDDAVIPADGHLLVAFGRDIGVELVAASFLDRDGDGVSLWDPGSIRADHVAWRELRGAPIESLARVPDGSDAWVRGAPTPGAANPEE